MEVDASYFSDPNSTRDEDLYSLVVVDPQHNLFDENRYNNQCILSGVTMTPDGTLYISGNPFAANTVTLSGSTVTFNGNGIRYSSAATNDVFFSGSTEADTFSANYARGVALIMVRLVFLAALSMLAATFLSFPVAILLCLVVFSTAAFSGFIVDSFDYLSEKLSARY